MVKRYKKGDPCEQREESKYEHPVASREYITQYLEQLGCPATFHHLAVALGANTEEEKEGFRRRLKAMIRDGQLMQNRRGSYALVDQLELIRGRVVGHRDGYGFLIPDEGGDDVFLPARQMSCVFTDDRVLARVTGHNYRGRREGAIVEILARNTHQIVGRYIKEGNAGFVDPDNKTIAQDIIIPHGEEGGAQSGQFVVADITAQPSYRRQPTGTIVEILGDSLTPGMEVELALRSRQLPFNWPDHALVEAKKLATAVTADDIAKRRDLRNLSFVTIDGEDAKDFDDAVYCEPVANGGWRLYIAIADVTHYVKPHSVLDQEAATRGNSVYFPARVIPMLPEILSNGLCSLKPKVDRLVMVCDMLVNSQGEVVKYQFDEAVIHSQARLTYNQVAAMLNGDSSVHQTILPHLEVFHRLFKQLLKQRRNRGAIEFETIETQIIFDHGGKIQCILPRERNVAHQMIEEAMLLANVTAARHLEKAKLATLFRVHEGPDAQKLIALKDFLKAFGLRLSGGNKPTPKDYAKLLKRIEKRDDAHLLQTVMLRSLKQAVYHPDNLGHFGLNYPSYCHFTSPIRRYPDMLVHRGLKHLLNKKSAKKFKYSLEDMEHYAEHCSMTERRADLASRDATDWLKCDYMLNKVGKEFAGIIADVTSFGVFVELKDIYVHGLLHITALPNDYYHYDATHHLLRGKRTNKTYRLGDTLRVLVARVDLDARTIDFDLVSD